MSRICEEIGRIHKNTRHRIKDDEKSKIYQIICLEPGITRKSIVSRLQMRPTTVSNMVSELLKQNLVNEGEVKNGKRAGRPEVTLSANYNVGVCIAVYVLSKHLKAVVVNLIGEVLYETEVYVPEDVSNDELLETLVGLINPLKQKIPASSRLLGAGISFTGSINRVSQKLMNTVRWSQIQRFPLKKLRDRIDCELTILPSLEAQLAHLLLEVPSYRKGGTLLYHWGYGIGASYAKNGHIVTSTPGYVMEIGHIPFDSSNTLQCKCGRIGCLEASASIWALQQQLKDQYPDFPEDENQLSRYVVNIKLADNPVIKQAVQGVAGSLAILHEIFFPDRIILSSSFAVNPRLFADVKEQFLNQISLSMYQNTELIPLSPEFRGEIFGSTYGLFRKFLREELIAAN